MKNETGARDPVRLLLRPPLVADTTRVDKIRLTIIEFREREREERKREKKTVFVSVCQDIFGGSNGT